MLGDDEKDLPSWVGHRCLIEMTDYENHQYGIFHKMIPQSLAGEKIWPFSSTDAGALKAFRSMKGPAYFEPNLKQFIE